MFVKICGITNEEDALLAVAMGADAVGFVFAPSTRQIAPAKAGHIIRRLPTDVLTVGVFRNEARQRVVELVNKNGLKAAQLHGTETAADTKWVRERIPIVIKAFAPASERLERAADYGADAVLVDAVSPGSGQMFDWSLAEDAPSGLRLILAGGLRPENVAEAIGKVRPFGVDVASGVESTPGRKDPRLVKAFINAAKRAARPAVGGGPADGELPYDWQEDF